VTSDSHEAAFGSSSAVGGGVAATAPRGFVALDVATSENLLVGVHVGYISSSDPLRDPSLWNHLHLEGRATFALGRRALAMPGGVPVITLGLGLAEYGVSVPVSVNVNGSTILADAWRRSGPWFVAAGFGTRIKLESWLVLSFVPIRATVLWGGPDSERVLWTPEIATQIGF
jgi:hypothetical protein